ncbi:MAG: HK97-gp10 family putative phage morphogenesis protein [Shewanella sp.]
MRVEGLKELDAALSNLKSEVANKVIFRAALTGAKVIQKEAQARAPVGTKPHKLGKNGETVQPGNLKRSIVTRRVKKTTFDARYDVDIRKSKRRGAFYGRFLEYGTKFMAAQPFMRPALSVAGESAKNAAIDALRKGIDNATRKAANSKGVIR